MAYQTEILSLQYQSGQQVGDTLFFAEDIVGIVALNGVDLLQYIVEAPEGFIYRVVAASAYQNSGANADMALGLRHKAYPRIATQYIQSKQAITNGVYNTFNWTIDNQFDSDWRVSVYTHANPGLGKKIKAKITLQIVKVKE